jgi:hypothetical protein
MSEENVELAECLIRDFNRRDLPAVTEAFDREIEWRPGGPAAVERASTGAATRSRTGLPRPGTPRGSFTSRSTRFVISVNRSCG